MKCPLVTMATMCVRLTFNLVPIIIPTSSYRKKNFQALVTVEVEEDESNNIKFYFIFVLKCGIMF
jgi:hypothetical protein